MGNHSRHQNLRGTVDWSRFGRRIAGEIDKTNMTFRELAAEMKGPSAPTLNRICHGKPCSVELYLWICGKFSISPTWAYKEKTE
jgi:hypothetical protein